MFCPKCNMMIPEYRRIKVIEFNSMDVEGKTIWYQCLCGFYLESSFKVSHNIKALIPEPSLKRPITGALN